MRQGTCNNLQKLFRSTLLSAAMAGTAACSTTGGIQPEAEMSAEERIALMEAESRIRREEAVEITRMQGQELVQARHTELQLVNDRLYAEELHLNIVTKVNQINAILETGELTNDDIRNLVLPLERLLTSSEVGARIGEDMGVSPDTLREQWGARMAEEATKACSHALSGIQAYTFEDIGNDGRVTAVVAFDEYAFSYGDGVPLLRHDPTACAPYGDRIYSVLPARDENGKPVITQIRHDPRFETYFPRDYVTEEPTSEGPQ